MTIVRNVLSRDSGYTVSCAGVFPVGDIAADKILTSVIRRPPMVWDTIALWVEMWSCAIKPFNKIISWLCRGAFRSRPSVRLEVSHLAFHGFEMRASLAILVCCYTLIRGTSGTLMELTCFLLRIHCSVSKHDAHRSACWENMFAWLANLLINQRLAAILYLKKWEVWRWDWKDTVSNYSGLTEHSRKISIYF